MLGHLGAAWKHLLHSPCALEALTSPSRLTFSPLYLQNHTKNGLLVVGAGRLIDQQPASGLLDLGILVPSSAILPLAMLEPKYSMVSRLLCSLCALSVSPNRSPCSNDPAQLRIVMVLDQNSPTACMERRPVVFTVPLERRLKKIWGLLHEIQPRTALSKPMRRPEDT